MRTSSVFRQSIDCSRKRVGYAANNWCVAASRAAEPPSRRARARRRHSQRLPPQTNRVGASFQPATVSSNQVIMSSGVSGCWPACARRTGVPLGPVAGIRPDSARNPRARWKAASRRAERASARSQSSDAPRGCPRRGSGARGGKASRGEWPSQVSQRASLGRSSSWTVTSGSVAPIAVNSACSQGCNTVFGEFLTPFSRTSPV